VRGWKAIRKGEPQAIVRFAAVGLAATTVYLGASLLLLNLGWLPLLAHLCAFGLGWVLSYAGHYFFTFRASSPHVATTRRFGLVTVALLVLSSAAQQLALWSGVSPKLAAFLVAGLYAGLSFLLNNFWTFSQRRGSA